MNAKINFFPLGNADTLRLDLVDGRKILIDYADMRDENDDDDKRCDLPTELRNDLNESGRDYYDAVCITHTDSDHCKGFGEFFWLEHAAKYQSDERTKIKELWVPAAAILEEGLKGDARLVRTEARHRFREGKGVLVFSYPDALRDWLENEGLNFEDRKELIVDAGQLVPGYSKSESERVEFFVHSPFGWRQNENSVISRNEDSIAIHATFAIDSHESCLFLASDINHETLTEIVKITQKNGNQHRLRWDIMKLMHHCSYLSLGPERGVHETKPVSEVEWLLEQQRNDNSTIVSPSLPIPKEGSEEDESIQPPHRQAANYYRRIIKVDDGEFMVTMEHPDKSNPQPFTFEVTKFGISLAIAFPMLNTVVASSTPRAG